MTKHHDRVYEKIIRKYVESDASLLHIVSSSDGVNSPVLNAMRALCESSLQPQSALNALQLAKTVSVESLDPRLCILFLCTWVQALLTSANREGVVQAEADGLLHRASALLSASIPAEIRAYVHRLQAQLHMSHGRISQAEQTLTAEQQDLSNGSPRCKYITRDLSALLAATGRLKSIEPEFSRLTAQCSTHFPERALLEIRITNAMETGHATEAEGLARSIGDSPSLLSESLLSNDYQAALGMMLQPATHVPVAPSEPIAGPGLSDTALVLQCLLAQNAHQALRWSRLCERRRPLAVTGTGFMAFNLLRAELAEGNREASERLLALRHNLGNNHFLDDFFLARMSLLRNDLSSAVHYFAALLDSADEYGAEGRIEFELRLAVELPRSTVLTLTRRAETIRVKRAARKKRPVATMPKKHDQETGVHRLLGQSPSLIAIRNKVELFADSDLPLLITGETGTGKELVAHALHETSSRSEHPFITVNCGAISESLLESELFGHEKGAFSGADGSHRGLFEEAADGTIFLDEIGEISSRLQIALLRVLETSEIRAVGSSRVRSIGCRVLTATNVDLWAAEREGTVRRDLLFRLQKLEISIPPLREHPEDVLILADYFLNMDRTPEMRATLSPRLRDMLLLYAWPGNVRELKSVIERARLMNSGKLFYDVQDLDIPGVHILGEFSPSSVNTQPESAAIRDIKNTTPLSGRSRIRRLERLRELFMQHNLLTRTEIAALLQVSPNTASADLKQLALDGIIDRIQPTRSPRSTYFVLHKSD